MLRTESKILIARALNRVILGARRLVGKDSRLDAVRRGIKWRLDLNEGIDLAIYLGLYQTIPGRLIERWIPPGSLVLDVGANVGAHTLSLARRVGAGGCVVAVEPTDYAIGKLKANIEINPELKSRVIAVQAALTDDRDAESRQAEFYSRWPLRGDSTPLHKAHQGRLEAAGKSRFLRLDELVDELRMQGRVGAPVAFVKLDVDGNELKVLRGGVRLFMAERPVILLEIAPYVQDEQPGRLEALLQTLAGYGYRLEFADTGGDFPMSAEAVRRLIANGAGLDVVARAG